MLTPGHEFSMTFEAEGMYKLSLKSPKIIVNVKTPTFGDSMIYWMGCAAELVSSFSSFADVPIAVSCYEKKLRFTGKLCGVTATLFVDNHIDDCSHVTSCLRGLLWHVSNAKELDS